MNRTTVADLVLYITQLQPAQKVDEYTADAWFDVIGDLPATLTQGRAAVARVARRQQWISASDVRGELMMILRPAEVSAPAPAIEAPSKWEPSEERATRIRRRIAEVTKELEEHRRESEPELEEGVSETLQRAREVARQYKRERDRPEQPRPLASTVGHNPAALVDQFQQLPERRAE